MAAGVKAKRELENARECSILLSGQRDKITYGRMKLGTDELIRSRQQQRERAMRSTSRQSKANASALINPLINAS